ncbi:hypothetical protein GJAV_G00196420 [Gymnothorax javanicus]|nr:hypothetical protein GJAV_G00196420 [Gymnothorax javanicus]
MNNNIVFIISGLVSGTPVQRDMKKLTSLLKLLLLLAAVPQGTPTSCNITDGSSVKCSEALGQPVYINLITDQKVGSFLVKFNRNDICRYRAKNKSMSGPYKDHCHFFGNRTLRLDNLTKSYSGTYMFDVFDKDGENILKASMSLTIQGHSTETVIFATLGTCVLLLALLCGVGYYYYKKKQKLLQTTDGRTSAKDSLPGDKSEDPQEIVYCQVQVGDNKKQPKKKEQEPQVVYGEVKVPDDARP